MRKCTYCGYISKANYTNCPKCGATEHEDIDNLYGYEVKEKVKVNMSSIDSSFLKIDKRKKHKYIFLIILVLLLHFGKTMFSSLFGVMDVFINQPENTGKLVGVLFLYISSLAADITAFTIIIMNHRNLKRYILCLLGLIFGHFLITVFLAYDFYIKDNIALAMLVAINNVFDFFTMGASYICALLISKLLLLNWDKKKNKKLIDKGVIIKNLEYTLVPDKINPSLKRIKVNYVSKNGIDYDLLSKQLISYEPSDKTVDLLIDQDDVSNYYIDFEIV